MLNKDDIQIIRQVVKEEVSDLINPINKNIKTLKKDVSSLKTDMKEVKSDMRTLKHDVSYIEDHLQLPPLQAN